MIELCLDIIQTVLLFIIIAAILIDMASRGVMGGKKMIPAKILAGARLTIETLKELDDRWYRGEWNSHLNFLGYVLNAQIQEAYPIMAKHERERIMAWGEENCPHPHDVVLCIRFKRQCPTCWETIRGEDESEKAKGI